MPAVDGHRCQVSPGVQRMSRATLDRSNRPGGAGWGLARQRCASRESGATGCCRTRNSPNTSIVGVRWWARSNRISCIECRYRAAAPNQSGEGRGSRTSAQPPCGGAGAASPGSQRSRAEALLKFRTHSSDPMGVGFASFKAACNASERRSTSAFPWALSFLFRSGFNGERYRATLQDVNARECEPRSSIAGTLWTEWSPTG